MQFLAEVFLAYLSGRELIDVLQKILESNYDAHMYATVFVPQLHVCSMRKYCAPHSGCRSFS